MLVVLERVSSMPGQGVVGVFSLGDSFGCIRGVVAAKGLPLELVTAQAWKKRFGLTADKEQARAKAIQLYPDAPFGPGQRSRPRRSHPDRPPRPGCIRMSSRRQPMTHAVNVHSCPSRADQMLREVKGGRFVGSGTFRACRRGAAAERSDVFFLRQGNQTVQPIGPNTDSCDCAQESFGGYR